MKKISLIFLSIFLLPLALLFIACGETGPNITGIEVSIVDNNYQLENNTITFLYGDEVNITDSDFSVKLFFDDDTTQIIQQGEGGYSYSSNLPQADAHGKIPVGEYALTFSYGELEDYVITIKVVQKTTINVANLEWTNPSVFVYDGTQKSVVITTAVPNGLSITYSNNAKTNVGEYTATANFELSNRFYELSATSVTHAWSITRADVNTANVDLATKAFVYDGTLKTVTLVADSLPSGVTASVKSGSSATDVGDYTAVVEFSVNGNYNKPNDKNITWRINRADVDTSAIDLEIKVFNYDGTEKTVALIGTDGLPIGVSANIKSGASATDAGDYIAVVEFNVNDNYNKPADKEIVWKVNKIDVNTSTVDLETKVFNYDGTEKTVALIGTNGLPSGVTASIKSGASATNAGDYTAVIEFNVNGNYNKPANKNITWRINKADVDTSVIDLEIKVFNYDGTEKTIALIGTDGLPSGVTASIKTGASGTDVGDYTAVVEFSVNGNYNKPIDKNIAWRINDASVDTSLVDLGVKAFTYDGTLKTVTLTGTDSLPSGVTASIKSGASATDAGDYTAVVEFSVDGDHNKPADKNIAWRINKADANTNTVDLETKAFAYDGTEKTVVLTGTNSLPSGVTANIKSGASATNVGDYIAVVEFSVNGNYNKPANKEIAWKVNKAEVDTSAVDLETKSFDYDGAVKSVVIVGQDGLPAGITASIVSGDAARNAGNYTAIIEFTVSDNFTKPANKEINWTINKANVNTNIVDLATKSFDYDGAQKMVELTGDLPNGVVANLISGHVGVIAGNYTAVVEFTVNDNYNKPENKEIGWTINKANVNTSSVDIFCKAFDYDGVEKTVELYGVSSLPNGVSVDIISGGSATNAGNYTAVLEFTVNSNYNKPENKQIPWTINAQDIDVSWVRLSTRDYTYDGSEFTPELDLWSIPSYVEAEIVSGQAGYTNSATNVGEYKVLVRFTVKDDYKGNYNNPDDLELDWFIYDATITVQDVQFDNPRQYVADYISFGLKVKYSNSSEYSFSYIHSGDVDVVSITNQNGDAVADYSDITTEGTYTFVVRIGLNNEYNEFTGSYEYTTWSDNFTITLYILGPEDVSYFAVQSVDIVVGQKPLFYYYTYAGDVVQDADILDDMTYSNFDYNVAGSYTTQFEYAGIVNELTINVHDEDDARVLSLEDSIHVIGSEDAIHISVTTWAGDTDRIELTPDMITIGTLDLQTRGAYQFTISYKGAILECYMLVVSMDDISYAYIKKSEFPLGSTEKIVLNVTTYGYEDYELELTQGMLASGSELPNFAVAGEYNFTVNYLGYTNYYTVRVYDPDDTTVEYINWRMNSNLVWTYSVDGENVTLHPRLDGIYLYATLANKEEADIQLETSMVSFDSDNIINQIKDGNPTPICNVRITYQDVDTFANVVFVNEDNLDALLTMCEMEITQKGSYVEVIVVELGEQLKDYDMKFSFDGFSLYMPIHEENILNEDDSQHDISTAGLHTVYVYGQKSPLIVYDKNDADVYGYISGEEIKAYIGSTTQDIIDLFVGRDVAICYTYLYENSDYVKEYYMIVYHKLTALDINLDGIDLSSCGNKEIVFVYDGHEITLMFNITPNLEGQTKTVYSYDWGYGTNEVDVYEEYMNFFGTWVKYEYVDYVIGLITAYYYEDIKYMIKDDTKLTLSDFVASQVFGEEDYREFSYSAGGMDMTIRVYRNKYADIYFYGGTEYMTSLICKLETVGDKEYFTMNGEKFLVGESNVLTIEPVGEIIYTFHADAGTLPEMPMELFAEFRDDNGTKKMYYYTRNNEDSEYSLLGTLTWTINEERTLIECYQGTNKAVSFILVNNEIVGMEMEGVE